MGGSAALGLRRASHATAAKTATPTKAVVVFALKKLRSWKMPDQKGWKKMPQKPRMRAPEERRRRVRGAKF